MSTSVCAKCNGSPNVLNKRKSDDADTASDEEVATFATMFYWCQDLAVVLCRAPAAPLTQNISAWSIRRI